MQQATVNLFADMGAQPGDAPAWAGRRRRRRRDIDARRRRRSPRRSAGASRAERTPVTITGTAADTGGGVVGGVEVSVDGGATWHRATGRDELELTPGRPARPAPATIKSRAVDDSGNIEAARRPVTVTITPAMLSRAPICERRVDAWQVDVDDDKPGRARREVPRATVSGYITGMRFYKGVDQHRHARRQPVDAAAGTLLATAHFTDETPRAGSR